MAEVEKVITQQRSLMATRRKVGRQVAPELGFQCANHAVKALEHARRNLDTWLREIKADDSFETLMGFMCLCSEQFR
ncbi:hypothetical protein GCM10007989_37240 [Devosia pacifica]|uniref:Uncharacterized protein n=1 Tax=Devosia pacifica TaxID=1335967 RepID=A0A918VYM4_9HYPH|nr:hypothetical protein GCM10007989_37240 [Devosia pacifica]